MSDGLLGKAATMEIPIGSNGDAGSIPEDDGLEQDLQQVMVSGPNLNETSIVSGGYGGSAEGIVPSAAIKGSGLHPPHPGSGATGEEIVRGIAGEKFDIVKKWGINTYKCTKQLLSERFGRGSRTVDLELEAQIELLRETKRKYELVLQLARALAHHFYSLVQTQRSLGDAFADLSQKAPELQEEFGYNAETQKLLCRNGETLLGAVNFFVSSIQTLVHKTMEDTLLTVKHYESARRPLSRPGQSPFSIHSPGGPGGSRWLLRQELPALFSAYDKRILAAAWIFAEPRSSSAETENLCVKGDRDMDTGASRQPLRPTLKAQGSQSKVSAPRVQKMPGLAEKPVIVGDSCGQPTPPASTKETSLATRQRTAAAREMELPLITELNDMSEASCRKEAHLVTAGKGPVVYAHPNRINFGKTPVLQDVSQPLYLSNQTPVPAPFWAEMVGKSSRWRVEPSKGVIPPNAQLSVAVIVNLDDNKVFEDEVKVFIEKSPSFVIPVQATGIGHTIVADKPVPSELILGPQFSLTPVCYRFKATNKGRRTHLLYWKMEGTSAFPQRHRPPALSSAKEKESPRSSKSARPAFRLHPPRMELMPGKSMEVVLECFSSTPQVVRGRLSCHAFAENKSRKVEIMQVDVACEFVAPVLEVSCREITFQVTKQASDDLTLQYKPLSLKNLTPLPLSTVLAVEQPFSICDADQQPLPADAEHVKLEVGEELRLSVGCNPAYHEDAKIWDVEKALTIRFLEHPHEEQVTVRVFFPKLHIPTTAVDFGCILNDTEDVRYVQMTNCSSHPVRYHWVFVADSVESQSGSPKPLEEESSESIRPVSAQSSCEEGRVEERVRGLETAQNPLLMTKDEDDFLEAKVFDILPRFSVLQPNESHWARVTFFGHANIVANVLALCRVEGGPAHEVTLSGEASFVDYHLETTEIHYGLQVFNQVLEAKITLLNRGKLGFTYEVLNPSMATADCPRPREPLILPSTGFLGPGQEQVLKIYYLPAVPGVFCRTFRVRMGHLEPREISLDGEGCFPRLSLDLPRNIKGNEKYEKVHQEAKEKVEQDSQRDQVVALREAVALESPTDGSDPELETQIQMRMEEMLVEEHTLQQLTALASSLPADCAFDHQARCRLLEAELPEYILDFGHVILSSVHTRTVTVTNTGQFPMSFHSNGSVLHGTGFVVEPNHVRDLPCCETKALKVCFDPESANLPLGQVDALLPIKVEEGPTFHIRLRANVALPSLCLSRDSLEFSAVQCGQCKEETIQLHNRLQVPCKWVLTISDPVKKVDKSVQGRAGQKLLQEVRKKKPHVFTALPTAGTLSPGQWCNVKIRFSPTEEKSYESILEFDLCQSSQRLQLPVSGHGLEPQLEFCPPALELGPVLPNSQGAEGTVTVKNPCEFPIEFYSLEFDHQYLKEEQILRMLKDYDSQNTMLLPPRAAGDKLPQELLEYYEDQMRLQDEQSKSESGKPEGPANAEPEASTANSKEAAEEENDSPVYKAIARHLGIDISAEGRAAQNRRGVVVIIHGAPLAGKTSAATALSKYYGAACLSIDTIVTEAITNSTSLAGLRARDLCMAAACEQSCKDAEDTDISSRRKPRTQSRLKDSLTSIVASRVQSTLSFIRTPKRQRLSSSSSSRSSTVGKEGFMSCVLPEDLLVEILSERLQRRDCYQGVVFDSLETGFAPSMSSALLCLLRALKNRRHIYFVNLSQDYTSWKSKREKKKDPAVNVNGIRKQQSKVSLKANFSAEGEAADSESGESEVQAQSNGKKNLAMKFQTYEAAQKDVAHILSSWDRAQGILLPPVSHKEKRLRRLSILKSWKDKKERREKNRPEKKLMAELKAADDSKVSAVEEEAAEEASRGQDIGVPCLEVQVPTAEDVVKEILESGKLPPAEQILDELGLGPSGPPIPSAAFFSVVHYPEERVAPAADPLEHFFFVDPEDATVEGKKKGTSSHLLVPAALTVKKSKSLVALTRGKLKKEKAVHGQKTSKDRESSNHGRKGHRAGSRSSSKVNLSNVERAPTPQRPARLSQCRWIVPAHGKVELKVFFSSMELGQFDQRLHFEVVGTKRQYQLQCRGTCLYPTISQDPRVVFPHCRKSKKADDVIFKQYVMDTGVFHFGPLFCGKSKDWHEVEHRPNYCEKITILNVSSWEEEVHFSFGHDHKRKTFHLNPPVMKLKPNEKQELRIWAHPTSAGLVEDNLICTIKENPESIVFQLCCQGILAKLEVGPTKVLSFSKVLLHRTERKTLALKNCTPLPMAWCISGLEKLGEGFSLSQHTGIIGPHAEFTVDLYFKATEIVRFKKIFQIEVSDVENLLGTLYTENIQVLVDVYDVSLDIVLPKGTADDCVDFGTRKVLDKDEAVLSLENKGRNDIGYRFKLETLDAKIPNLATYFSVQPQEGILTAYRKPMKVRLIFHPKTPVNITDKAILQCQVFDPDLSGSGEIISTIPVKVSASATFSKYSISPASFVSFGVMLKGTRKTGTFTIENKGIVAFKFSIQGQSKASAHQVKSNAQENKGLATESKTSLKQALAYVTFGTFTVHPGCGSIPPGGQQTITVECHAVSLGEHQEHLFIDIQDRDPTDNPLGIPYTLLAESYVPGFVVDDIESIFEEHRIFSSINRYEMLQTPRDKGVFIKDENRFIFTNVLVGQQATARFKVCNANKVPCNVALAVKPISAQRKREIHGVFKVDPAQMCVPGRSHAFATVTFTPPTVQNYQCTFEASIDTKKSSEAKKVPSLTFSISGAGNLHQLTVLHPVLRDTQGNPLLLFKKLLLGHSKELPLVLRNSGCAAIQFVVDLIQEGRVFFVKVRRGTRCIYGVTDAYEDSNRAEYKPHAAFLVLLPGETAEFDVLFKPTVAKLEEGKIRLRVVSTHREDIDIQLVGDCYEDDLVLENVHGAVEESEDKGSLSHDDIIEALRMDHIQFGECQVGMPYSVTFTITNRSRVDDMQFEWPAEAPFHFSPKVGVLPAGTSEDITLTLESDVPVTFERHPVKCWVSRSIPLLPSEKVTDRDERLHTVRGTDHTRDSSDIRLDKKVTEIGSECTRIVQVISHEVELHLSAVVDYANFKQDRHKIDFKETLLFQTKTFNFQLTNTGDVTLEYTWAVAEKGEKARTNEELPPSTDGNLPSTAAASAKVQSGQCLSRVKHAPESMSSSQRKTTDATQPFSVEPSSGTIPAGKEQLFQMKFSPVHTGVFKSVMSCRIPNLMPNLKGPEVTVKGRGLMPIYHFELEDSDYLTSKRYKLESKGRKHARPDPSTRVVEFATVGLCSRNSKTFTLLNPTSSTYSFQWTCHDPEDPLKQQAFFCLTERGQIKPGEKAKMQFEFVPQHLGVTESSWVLTISEQNVTVPFLLVGNATDPVVALDRPYVNFHSLLIGHEVQQVVYIINKEKETFRFAFRKSSPYSEGCEVKIEPLEGSIPPLSRLPITVALTPKQKGELVFNIKCDVDKKSRSLPLNIKAIGCSKVKRQKAVPHTAEKQ